MTVLGVISRLQTGLLIVSPLFVALVSIPVLAYQYNAAEFLSGARALEPFATIAILSAIFVIWYGISNFRYPRVALVMGGLAVFLVFQDALVPLRWAQLDGAERLSWTWSEAGLQLLVLLGIVAILRLTPVKHRCLLLFMVLAPTIVISYFTLVSASLYTDPRSLLKTTVTPRSIARPNVYEIVLDGFSGRAFATAEHGIGYPRRLDGFTRYANARASFVATDLSVPNFLTGTEPGSTAVLQWARRARTSGIREALVGQGYQLSLYVPDRARGWSSELSSRTVTSQDLSGVDQANLDRVTLLTIALVRTAPAPFRPIMLRLLTRFRIRDYLYYRQFSTDLVDRFVRDEKTRPATGQYIYIHLMLPHPPYVRSEYCAILSVSTYNRQAQCALRQAERVIDTLSRLGRLHGALIIVHSDHGMYTETQMLDARMARPTGVVAAAIARHAMDVGGLEGFLQRTDALLLLHVPDADVAPLRVSLAPALLSDLPATIAALVGAGPRNWPGVPLSSLNEDAKRDLPFFSATRISSEPLPSDAKLDLEPSRGWRFASSEHH